MTGALASRAAILGILAGVASSAACSVLFSVRDWDSQYGADGGGGSRGADGGGGLGGSAGSDASSDGGTDGAACSSCLGTCTDGRCDKALLVTAPGGATVQVIACSTNGWIYYVLSGGPDVLQVPSSGHTPACSCGAVDGEVPFDIAVGDGTVAWIAYSPGDMTRHVYTHPDVSCCPSSQGVEVATVNAGGAVEQFRSGIAVDDTNVYWVDTSDAQQAPLHPDAGPTIQLLSGEGYFTGIAVAGSNVLVNDANNKKLWAAPIGVAATGNSAPSFSLPDYGGAGIRVFGANAAWAYDHQTQNEVDFMPWDGGTACPVTVGIDNPTGLALDATYAYVSTSGDAGTLWRFPLSCGAEGAVLETTDPSIAEVCADSSNLYWIASEGIYRSEKTPAK